MAREIDDLSIVSKDRLLGINATVSMFVGLVLPVRQDWKKIYYNTRWLPFHL